MTTAAHTLPHGGHGLVRMVEGPILATDPLGLRHASKPIQSMASAVSATLRDGTASRPNKGPLQGVPRGWVRRSDCMLPSATPEKNTSMACSVLVHVSALLWPQAVFPSGRRHDVGPNQDTLHASISGGEGGKVCRGPRVFSSRAALASECRNPISTGVHKPGQPARLGAAPRPAPLGAPCAPLSHLAWPCLFARRAVL